MRIAGSGIFGSVCVAGLILGGTTAAFAQPEPQPPPAADDLNEEGAQEGNEEDGAQTAPPPAPAQPPAVDATLPDPPAPGQEASSHPDPPPATPTPFSSESVQSWEGRDELPLAGWHEQFFLRDAEDYFRLYPMARLQLDFHSTFGPGVGDKPPTDLLTPRMLIRRLRLELGGEILKRWSFIVGVEFGGQGLDNQKGTLQDAASPAGVDPNADTGRFSRGQGASSSAAIEDAYLNYSLCDCLNFMFGQYLTPFSMLNRTGQPNLPMMERNVAIGSFVLPSPRELGLTIWGDIGNRFLNYEVAVLAGDGRNRAAVDGAVDFTGRVAVRPLQGVSAVKKASIGVSARHGERDQEGVAYDYQAMTTQQGFSLWSPTYRDSTGRLVHVIPSGSQNQIGGELRVPFWRLDITGEAYYAANDTRDAIDGFQLTNTERLGRITGIGWYGAVRWWIWGDTHIAGDPGFSRRPASINLRKKPDLPRGFEFTAEVAGVHADFQPNARGGDLDDNSPGGPGNPATDISILQYGFGLSYWHTKTIRLMANYVIYHTPGSGPGSADNLAAVPGNLGEDADPDAHLMHELGTRISMNF